MFKVGKGVLTLASANSYSGVTEVQAGALVIGNDDALGSNTVGTIVLNGASLQMAGLHC